MDASSERDVKHRRPHPHDLAGPFLEFDLERELDELCREPEWAGGRNAKTLVKYDDLRIVLTAMKALRKMPPHSTEGRIALQVIVGHVLVRAEGRTFDLPAGRVVTFDRGVVHELEALDDSVVLQTITWPGTSESHERTPIPMPM
jgi:quercetin dioxygenase-like cupin family protein